MEAVRRLLTAPHGDVPGQSRVESTGQPRCGWPADHTKTDNLACCMNPGVRPPGGDDAVEVGPKRAQRVRQDALHGAIFRLHAPASKRSAVILDEQTKRPFQLQVTDELALPLRVDSIDERPASPARAEHADRKQEQERRYE